MDWSFVAVGPVRADVEVPAGEVNVSPDTEGAVHVSLEPRAGNGKKATELIESSRVTFDGQSLEVHVPSRRARNVELVCTVALPAGSDLTVQTASADLTCRGRIGNVVATVASGDVSLAVAAGDVTVASASGDVHIEDAGGSVKARSASGDIHIGRAHEGEIRVGTASGDVTVLVAQGAGAYLDLSSVTGDMSCSLPVEESSPADAVLRILCHSVSGDVRIGSAST